MLRNFLRTRLQTALQKHPQDNRGQWRKRALILVGITLVFFIVGHLSVRFILWPQIEKSKTTVEKLISTRLGADITMDHLQVSWTGMRPEFVIEGLRINSSSDSSTAPPLFIKNISGQLSWLSLYHLAPYFHEIHADNIELYAQRDAKGIISVASIPIHSKANDLSTENWLFSQNDIQIKNAKLFWEDQKSRKLKTVIDVQHFNFTNGVRQHQGELNVLTPWSPSPIKVQADFVHHLGGQAGNWRDWIGSFTWDVSDLNLSQISKDISLRPNELSGQLTSQGTIQLANGKANGGQMYLTADRLRIQLNKDVNAVEFGRIETNLVQEIQGGLNSITTKTLAWRGMDTQSTKPLDQLSPITFRWRTPEAGQEINAFGVSSPKVSLEDIALFALNLPLPKKIHQWIKAADADGELENLEINWSESKSALAALPLPGNWFSSNKLDFNVSAKLNDIGFKSINPSMPSVSHLTGNLTSNQKQGSLTVDAVNLELEMRNFLSAPQTKFDSVKGDLSWAQQKGGWLINAKQVQLSNSEITTNFDLSYLMAGPKQPDQMTLDMEFIKTKLATIHRYLPVGIDKDIRQYISKAFESGEIQKGSLHIKGNVDQIPFSPGSVGEFTLHLPISGATYKAAPLMPTKEGIWSAFTNINGTVDMKQSALNVSIDKATYKKVVLSNMTAQVPNVSAKQAQLLINALVAGDGSQIMEYLALSPVGVQKPDLMKSLSVIGPVNIDLGLKIPLSGNEGANVDAKLTLPGNRVEWAKMPPLENLKGTIRINEKNPEFEDITASFLGGDIKIASATSTPDNSSFNISGTANSSFLKAYIANNYWSQLNSALLNSMSGSAKYDGSVNFNALGSQTNLKIDLRNWASSAPAPANKLSGTAMLGQFNHRTFPTTKSNLVRADWSLKLGDEYSLQGNVDSSGSYRNAIGIGSVLGIPQQGLAINFASKEFNLDTWIDFIGSDKPKNNNLALKDTEILDEHIQVSAQIKKLIALDREWSDINFNGVAKNDIWQLRLDSPLIAGQVQLSPSSADHPSGLISGRISRIKVPDAIANTEVVSQGTNSQLRTLNQKPLPAKRSLTPNNIPSLDLSIDDLGWKQAQFGKVKLKTKTVDNVFKIESLQVSNPQGNSTITGQWAGKTSNTAELSSMTTNMDIQDAGEMISRWSDPKSVEGGQGKLNASLTWSGSFFAPDYNSISGNASIELAKGRLLEVNTGGAKLLDVLSLQSLFRFATLDLQGSLGNLATKGTPFNTISSQFDITQGIAQTKQFSMILDQARVAMTGNINIPQQTQDLRITIFPTIDATAGSLAAFALNPIIGLGVLVGQYLVTNQINRTMQTDYLVQGSWDKPEVIPLDQKGQPLDTKILETIRTRNLLKEQTKPSIPTVPSTVPSPSSALAN